jgi:hypothetical protein
MPARDRLPRFSIRDIKSGDQPIGASMACTDARSQVFQAVTNNNEIGPRASDCREKCPFDNLLSDRQRRASHSPPSEGEDEDTSAGRGNDVQGKE